MYGQQCMCTYTCALPCELFVDKSSTLTATQEWLILNTILCLGSIYISYLLYSCASLLFESMTAHGNGLTQNYNSPTLILYAEQIQGEGQS